MIHKVKKEHYSGSIKIPSSKSDTQRALILAFLAEDVSTLIHVGSSEDEKAILNAILELGAKVEYVSSSELKIKGISQLLEEKSISVGESGLGIRLLTSVAAIFDKKITLQGKGSLVRRPMDFFDSILPLFKVNVKTNSGLIPIEIKGPLIGNTIHLDGSLSSQFLSGLLISLPLSEKDSELNVKDLKSIPYVQMTLNSLSKFGIQIKNDDFKKFNIQGKQKVKATTYTIEGDWSSASYWLVASALGFDISVKNLNLDSLQADKEILAIFEKANCKISSLETGISIDGNDRKAFTADLTHCPDLFPALAVFASLTSGKSILIGTNRLIHKESNRAQAILEEFSKLGCQISLHENEMHIEGIDKLEVNSVDSHHDHRMAMSLAILGMFCDEEITIQNSEVVSKSYPTFWDDLNSLVK
ncbi:MAG: 3-phosphoshikimate 1-carboxyvinyltransferase [Flavobacteriia bacterium]|jgi:3-phosphoshikimate 1-carboxyvinyltransferase